MSNKNYITRLFAGIEFPQERKTGLIKITPLFENQTQLFEVFTKKANTDANKRLCDYMEDPKTIKLLDAIEVLSGLSATNAKGDFVHPVVFVDAMGWISVEFKIWATKLVMYDIYDQSIATC